MTTHSTSATRTTDTLRDAIMRGEYPAGTRLGEAELARRLGVSRTPVREALRQLTAEGLVELLPNRGATVAGWSTAELTGIFEARVMIEPLLTGRAAVKARPDDIAELRRLAQLMVACGEPGPQQDLEALALLNREFHDLLVTVADSPALAAALAGVIRGSVSQRNFRAYDASALRRSLAHHLEIVEAIASADDRWAAAVMTAHIQNARGVMLRDIAR